MLRARGIHVPADNLPAAGRPCDRGARHAHARRRSTATQEAVDLGQQRIGPHHRADAAARMHRQQHADRLVAEQQQAAAVALANALAFHGRHDAQQAGAVVVHHRHCQPPERAVAVHRAQRAEPAVPQLTLHGSRNAADAVAAVLADAAGQRRDCRIFTEIDHLCGLAAQPARSLPQQRRHAGLLRDMKRQHGEAAAGGMHQPGLPHLELGRIVGAHHRLLRVGERHRQHRRHARGQRCHANRLTHGRLPANPATAANPPPACGAAHGNFPGRVRRRPCRST